MERAMKNIAKSLKKQKKQLKTMKTIANHRRVSENIAKPMKKQRNHCKHNGMRMTTTGKTIEKATKPEQTIERTMETIAQPLGNL